MMNTRAPARLKAGRQRRNIWNLDYPAAANMFKTATDSGTQRHDHEPNTSRTLQEVRTPGRWRAFLSSVARCDKSCRLAADYHSLPLSHASKRTGNAPRERAEAQFAPRFAWLCVRRNDVASRDTKRRALEQNISASGTIAKHLFTVLACPGSPNTHVTLSCVTCRRSRHLRHSFARLGFGRISGVFLEHHGQTVKGMYPAPDNSRTFYDTQMATANCVHPHART